MSTSTRDQFLEAAIRQFANRGFYGASIAGIAAELSLTKQALLHHFGSKERLYGEILRLTSDRAVATMEQATREIPDPAERLEEVIVRRFRNELAHPDDTRLIMRELLDNEQRAERAGNWYLKPYLDGLIAMLRDTPNGHNLSKPQALAVIYQLLGATNYFANSQPTLRNMYGPQAFGETSAFFEKQLRQLIRLTLAQPATA